MDERMHELLIELRTEETRHSGRSLFRHLKNVHDLLRDWDNDDEVCHAGLFHSIYGTSTFKHRSLFDRERLIRLIGNEAERLVFFFSTAHRPFFDDVEDEKTRKKLLEIEAANLFEQGGNVSTLRKLGRMKGLSNGARAALNCGVI